jgi:hypothetical protein
MIQTGRTASIRGRDSSHCKKVAVDPASLVSEVLNNRKIQPQRNGMNTDEQIDTTLSALFICVDPVHLRFKPS